MVYIHVKKVGNQRYYTLRVSVRGKNGEVVTKDLETLGTDLSKVNLDSLEKKYKGEIRKSYKTLKRFLEENRFLEEARKQKLKKNDFFIKEQSEEIEGARLHYNRVFLKLDKLTKKEIYRFFLIKFAVSSTSIEGNTISLDEAGKLLLEDLLPKNKTLREVYDLQNTEKVFFELLDEMPEISLKMVEKVHDDLLDRIDGRRGYRAHDIRILGQPFKPSPGRYVKDDMKMLLKWYSKNNKEMHPLVLAILFHHKFESVHPFSDGNGRTGRILMNHILMKHKYPPLIVLKTLRAEYLESISYADRAIKSDLLSVDMKHYERLFSFMFSQFVKAYWNNFLI